MLSTKALKVTVKLSLSRANKAVADGARNSKTVSLALSTTTEALSRNAAVNGVSAPKASDTVNKAVSPAASNGANTLVGNPAENGDATTACERDNDDSAVAMLSNSETGAVRSCPESG